MDRIGKPQVDSRGQGGVEEFRKGADEGLVYEILIANKLCLPKLHLSNRSESSR